MRPMNEIVCQYSCVALLTQRPHDAIRRRHRHEGIHKHFRPVPRELCVVVYSIEVVGAVFEGSSGHPEEDGTRLLDGVIDLHRKKPGRENREDKEEERLRSKSELDPRVVRSAQKQRGLTIF